MNLRPRPRTAVIAVILLLFCRIFPAGAEVEPLPNAHAHNDYEHRRPLLDALENGFCGVEADIYLVNGKLLVAHDLKNVSREKTLQRLYLEPLKERVRKNGEAVYRQGPDFMLLIDIKSEAEGTYTVLREVLAEYRQMLTRFQPNRIERKAVTVILSGNRPTAMVTAESERFVAIDGRLADLGLNKPTALFPLISDNWKIHFSWDGNGPVPEAEREKLKGIVERAHQEKRVVRFWGTPDTPVFWRELRGAKVDWLNVDDLSGLRTFLQSGK
jgi:hypothetical protein